MLTCPLCQKSVRSLYPVVGKTTPMKVSEELSACDLSKLCCDCWYEHVGRMTREELEGHLMAHVEDLLAEEQRRQEAEQRMEELEKQIGTLGEEANEAARSAKAAEEDAFRDGKKEGHGEGYDEGYKDGCDADFERGSEPSEDPAADAPENPTDIQGGDLTSEIVSKDVYADNVSEIKHPLGEGTP